MDKKVALEKVKALTEKYQEVEKEGRVNKYNEEMTKKDFILPLFEALGWKTTDSREVSAEEKISKKRVDYGFRINGIPKFFLEAKSFKEDLDDRKYIEQAINYSWHKGCTWAILTNFESIKIFNAEVKTQHPWLSQLKPTLHCSEFLAKIDELLLLSRESFEKGLLDIEAEKWGKKEKKTPISKLLLDDFTHFRDALSKNIIKLNASKKLSEEELDEAVQRILDRLIFIRNCEDRELESKVLISNYREWESKGRGHLIKSLRDTFSYFDDEYNSKIFAEHLCDNLDIDNEVLHEVIEGLYYTKDEVAYDFSIIDADVLGTIYEQYLGNILRKTDKRAKLTENHAHRKEQGIYYTPPKIVSYIVGNTLGALLSEKKVDVEKVRILDPSCGSGSFLIKAFDFLNYHYQTVSEDYEQTQLDLKTGIPFKIKSRILQNNIFGVDLDKQAVEIAQLNLLLKIAEKGHRLPILEQNIRLGNSIINDEKVAGSKAFKWEESFDEIMKTGFDVVIGNPPYGAELNQTEKDFVEIAYPYASSNKNTALIFIGKSLELIRENGYVGLIVPKSLAYSQVWKSGRDLIKNHLLRIVDVSKAFEGVLLEQVIIILKKSSNTKNYVLVDVDSGSTISIDKKYIDATDSIILHGEKDDFEIFKKLNESGEYLAKITETRRGLPFQKYLTQDRTNYPIIRGKTISRFNFGLANEYFPNALIEENRAKLSFYVQPKIVSQRIVAHVTQPKDHIIIMSAIDKEGVLNVDTVENTVLTDKNYSLEFLLCLLNSKLISWYAYRYIFSKAIRTMDFDNYYVGKIPLPKNKVEYDSFVSLGTRMTIVCGRLAQLEDKMTDEKMQLEEEKKKIETDIDNLVYKTYWLSDAEKEIIENSLR